MKFTYICVLLWILYLGMLSLLNDYCPKIDHNFLHNYYHFGSYEFIMVTLSLVVFTSEKEI